MIDLKGWMLIMAIYSDGSDSQRILTATVSSDYSSKAECVKAANDAMNHMDWKTIVSICSPDDKEYRSTNKLSIENSVVILKSDKT